MKKLLVLVLSFIALVSLSACEMVSSIMGKVTTATPTTTEVATTGTMVTTLPAPTSIKETTTTLKAVTTFMPCDHEYETHYGLMAAFSEKRLVNWYTCPKCDGWFNENKKQVVDPTNTTTIRIESKKGKTTSINVIGSDFEIFYNDQIKEEILDLREKCKKALEEQTLDIDTIVEWDDRNGDLMVLLIDDYRHVSIAADMFAFEKYYTLADEILAEYYDMDEYNDLFNLTIASTKYRNEYYKDMTDEEIDAYIADIDPETNSQAVELRKTMDNITTEYQSNPSADIGEYFTKYRDAANAYAKLYGYNNYLEYAFGNIYGREYTVSDAAKLEGYIKNYISQVYEYYTDQLTSIENRISSTNYNHFVNIYMNTFYAYRKILQAYGERIGQDYLDNYNGLFESGNYYISNVSNDNTTAYCSTYADGTQYMVLGNSYYQAVGTFIHEFGHYNAGCFYDVESYDLAEVQSQGNEALFYTYIENDGTIDKSADAIAYYVTYNRLNFVETVYNTYLCSYVETKAYSAEGEVTSEQLQGWWDEGAKNLGKSDLKGNTYWEYALMQSPGYYISYSTSAIATVELMAVSLSDFDSAVQIYNKIFNFDSEKYTTFTAVLEQAGLVSIFDEQCYKNIVQSIIK